MKRLLPALLLALISLSVSGATLMLFPTRTNPPPPSGGGGGASCAGARSGELCWTQPANVTTNNIWIGTSPGIYTTKVNIASPATAGNAAMYGTWLLGLTQGTTYYYRVSGVKSDGSEGFVSTGEVTQVCCGDDGWAVRSSGPGVKFANRLDTTTAVNTYKFARTGVDSIIQLDTSIKPNGASGSIKFNIPNTETTGNWTVSIPFNDSFGAGESFWTSYRVWGQPQDFYAPYIPIMGGSTSGTATKWSIISIDVNAQAVGTYHSNEIVVQENDTAGQMANYRGHVSSGGGSQQYDPFRVTQNDGCQNGDIRASPAWDRGAGSVVPWGAYPLSGNNPDTGLAWSNSSSSGSDCANIRARYADLYWARSAGPAPNYRFGLGDPFSGGPRACPGVRCGWITVTTYVRVGCGFGCTTADSRVAVMVAYGMNDYQVVIDELTTLGEGNNGDGSACISDSDCQYRGLNLTTYTTERDAGGRQVTGNTGQLNACFEVWNVSPTFPTGSATLAYSTSTQKFTLTANGESAGTARGYSAANGFVDINIGSSVSSSFINGHVTPSGCTSTTSETLTIGTGRPDTKRNYSDAIVSTLPIKAPNGNAPPITTP